jgi:hypothetical protein
MCVCVCVCVCVRMCAPDIVVDVFFVFLTSFLTFLKL